MEKYGDATEYFSVTKEVEFDMGHRVPNHHSKCRNPHGHRYKVQARVRGPLVNQTGASSEGMVIDFGDIKGALMSRIHDLYDHGFMRFKDDRELDAFAKSAAENGWNFHDVDFIPTAENLAKHFYELISEELLFETGLSVQYVDVYETPTSVARFPG